jgi:Protein of unknown function (DUF3089)
MTFPPSFAYKRYSDTALQIAFCRIQNSVILSKRNPMPQSRLLFIFPLMLALTACWRPFGTFENAHQSLAPDYALAENWAALPDRVDNADRVPEMPKLADLQKESAADVFFIHPTTYLIGTDWNGDLTNETLNSRTDELSIFNQASAFNGAGRIYAPRYRQAHIYSFMDEKGNGDKALDFAWEDVKRAFEYYLEHYNRGRPIIIAAHSQGTRHALRLVKTFFDDNEALRKQLVAAFLIGTDGLLHHMEHGEVGNYEVFQSAS